MRSSHTHTITTTSLSTAGPSKSCPAPLPPADPVEEDEDDLEEDEDEIIRRVEEKVCRIKARKAAAAAKKKAEEEAAKKAAEEAQRQKEAAARELKNEVSASPRRPMVEILKRRSKGKGKAQVEPVGEDPDDGGNGDDNYDDEEERAPLKREDGGNLSGEHLAVLESQVAQLLTDNWQLRDGQVKANTYHRHFNRKVNWLITEATRRKRTPPEMPEAGLSGLSKKRRRVMNSDEEEERGRVEEKV
ncbi:hypothetical protein F5051DRAFT_440763 [Lentinula edodes]|nr:hypothetical protein F5051DRAFT_440763 [Lentinula edodes]